MKARWPLRWGVEEAEGRGAGGERDMALLELCWTSVPLGREKWGDPDTHGGTV